MNQAPGGPTTLGTGGRRVVFYLFFDPQGVVDDYIPYKLERLRAHAEHIFVIVNGTVTPAGRARLEAVADTVWQRENVGFDVWGYKEALERFGGERLAEYDELILMNYTFYGPVGSFDGLFERMNAQAVDFWGVTDHGPTPSPFTPGETLPAHLQSHWIAVRRRMFVSPEWQAYWAQMPAIRSYQDSVTYHEARFTQHFAGCGFACEIAYPHQDYGNLHPAFISAYDLIEQGCPVLKRRIFFHDPLYLDREVIIGRWIAEAAARRGYPVELIWSNAARTAPPKVLNTNASMLEILPEAVDRYDGTAPPRLAAIVHIFYEDMTDELLDRLELLPAPYDLYVTTTDEEKAVAIRATLDARTDLRRRASEVRVLPSNRGRDISAFYVGCRDVLQSDAYDLVVKIHSKKTAQMTHNAGSFFKRQQLDNLLHSEGYAANLIGLFQREPRLGAVFAPTIHIGYPTLGAAWFANREGAEELAQRLGIHVPLDRPSPLAPLGSMFVARPDALEPMLREPLDYDDYPAEGDYGDGGLAHVQERMVAYSAGERGYHVRTVANADYAAISHTFLEYKLDQLAESVPGYAIDQVRTLRTAGLSTADPVRYAKAYVTERHPSLARGLARFYRPLRAMLRRRRGRGS